MLLLPVLAQQQPGCNVSSISSSNFSKFVTTSFSSNKTSNGHKSYAFTCQSSSTSSSSASLATLQQKQKHFQNNIQTAAVFSGQVPRRPTSARQKLKVAVDVDEVLGRFLHSLNNFCMEEYGLEYAVSDYHVYDFAKVWRCSQDESNHKVHEFFKSSHFSSGIEAIPGAFDSLSRLRSECELMVVTSRQHIIQQPTLDWLEAHFPGVFGAVHFGNHFALEGVSRKKSEICNSIGAHVLIDDNPSYAMECAAAGINVLLYDWEMNYPWSKTPCGPTDDRITRVRDWAEVEQVLTLLAAASRK